MGGEISRWYKNFRGSDKSLAPMETLVRSGKNSISYNRRIMKKTVDLSWVDAIEEGLLHIDKVIRNPRVTIEDNEEIVPIALSKKITVESIKHLAQHTNLIQDIDEKTGRITPSKILNIYKEESLLTYENKFLNTLIDRLYIFVTRRYEKLKEVTKDEDAYSLDYSTVTDTGNGGSCRFSMKVEISEVPDNNSESGYSTWERIEKIKLAVESYKSSKFCQKMGNAFIRPPVMKTNAITKNVDLKACLVLWQFIEGYDKVGYDIYTADSAQNPSPEFISDLNRMASMNYMLLGYHTGLENTDDIRGRKKRTYSPKIIKQFNLENTSEYDVTVEEEKSLSNGYRLKRELPENSSEIAEEIDKIIAVEKQYLIDEENHILEEKRLAEEAERRKIEEEMRRAEEQRLMAERKREQERLEEEKRLKEEKEKKLREIMEQKKREEEERIFREQEELKRKERERAEAEERARAEEEQRQREEQERIESAKRAEAELVSAVENESDENIGEIKKRREEETNARLERERISAERVQRLRAERKLIESKPFEVIYAEYSKNPYYVAKRGFKKLMKFMGHTEDTSRMSAESLELLKIEKRLEQYTLEEKRIEKEKKSQQRQEKIRIRNVFDANSSNPLKKLRYKITVFLNKKR
ncbi:MAG: hypothetical protein SPE43_06615 [Ruminococcus sp.]|nr:hypothetical protein [Ruminococcus sp.]